MFSFSGELDCKNVMRTAQRRLLNVSNAGLTWWYRSCMGICGSVIGLLWLVVTRNVWYAVGGQVQFSNDWPHIWINYIFKGHCLDPPVPFKEVGFGHVLPPHSRLDALGWHAVTKVDDVLGVSSLQHCVLKHPELLSCTWKKRQKIN